MKAISIRQPNLDAILGDQSSVEVRRAPTRHRGEILLHASRVYGAAERARLQLLRSRGASLAEPDPSLLGAIVGRATLTGCRPATPAEAAEAGIADGEPAWAWLFESARRLAPVPFRGRVYMFEVEDETAAQLAAAS